MRCHVPRQSSPSRTGTDSPAGPSSIDMQCEWPLPNSWSSVAHVLGAAIPVVVGVVVLRRHEPLQHHGEVLEEPALPLVDAHRAGRVGRVDAADAGLDPALADGVAHLVRDVGHREPTRRAQLHLTLERLHGRIPSVVSATRAALVHGIVTVRVTRQREG